MSESHENSAPKPAPKNDKIARRAAALRENLLKRKQQVKARAQNHGETHTDSE